MKIIYTISHPLTKEIVYVGCTKNYIQRVAAYYHLTDKRTITRWIIELRKQDIEPKFDIIDEVENDLSFFFETYWIHQLTTWGCNLLNTNKTIPMKYKNPNRNIPKRKVYYFENVEIGDTLLIDISKYSSFKVGISQFKKRYGIKLSYKIQNDESIISSQMLIKYIKKQNTFA